MLVIRPPLLLPSPSPNDAIKTALGRIGKGIKKAVEAFALMCGFIEL